MIFMADYSNRERRGRKPRNPGVPFLIKLRSILGG